MASFKDTEGRKWTVQITVLACKRVRDELGVDLVNPNVMETVSEIAGDLIRSIDILYLICKDQAEERGLSDEDFGRSLAGEVVEQAIVALVESLADFSPNPKQGELLRETWKIGYTLARDKQTEAIAKVMSEDLEAVMEAKYDEALANISQKTPGNSSGLVQESAE